MAEEDNIWQALPRKEDEDKDKSVLVCFVTKITRGAVDPSKLPLDVIVRNICQARIQAPLTVGGPSTIRTTLLALYDALGLLRAVQYDVQQFNTCYSVTVANQATELGNEEENDIKHSNRRLYHIFRLLRQCREWGLSLEAPTKDAAKFVPAKVPGLDSLITYIEKEYADRVATARALIQDHGIVDFDSLAEYLVPGRILVDTGLLSGCSSAIMAVRSRACFYRRGKTVAGKIVSTLEASLEMVVATGNDGTFAVTEARIIQQEFGGTRRIAINDSANKGVAGLQSGGEMLFLPPKQTDDNENDAKSLLCVLEERGQFYESLIRKPVLVNYAAGAFFTPRASRASGRLMVDTVEAWTRNFHAAKPPCDGAAADAVMAAHQTFARWKRATDQQQQQDKAQSAIQDAAQEHARLQGDVLLLQGAIPNELLPCTWPMVCGFSMSSRQWGLAQVEYLSAVQFREDVFDQLVLPPARKRLVRALVASHMTTKKADVLPGKGEGIIFLLHGPSGCGKTLTAEAVSEVLHRPLYRVSMGELGTTPEDLEKRLQDILDLCQPWQALVLMDEADMFLETRQGSNSGGGSMVRQAMVCVMLRLMEYYPGILFLTTNVGMERLDPAIASRLTCTLPYHALDAAGRLAVWESCLNRVRIQNNQMTNEELEKIATEYDYLNGRQIKNAVQLASALCQYEETVLTVDQIHEILAVTAPAPSI